MFSRHIVVFVEISVPVRRQNCKAFPTATNTQPGYNHMVATTAIKADPVHCKQRVVAELSVVVTVALSVVDTLVVAIGLAASLPLPLQVGRLPSMLHAPITLLSPVDFVHICLSPMV